MRAVRFVTFGCKANQYDTQLLRETLRRRGWTEEREADLVVGRRTTHARAVELTEPADKARVLRPYLEKWKMEVGAFFEGVGPDATVAELEAITGNHPVFALELD